MGTYKPGDKVRIGEEEKVWRVSFVQPDEYGRIELDGYWKVRPELLSKVVPVN